MHPCSNLPKKYSALFSHVALLIRPILNSANLPQHFLLIRPKPFLSLRYLHFNFVRTFFHFFQSLLVSSVSVVLIENLKMKSVLVIKNASREDWTLGLWFTRPALCHWAMKAVILNSKCLVENKHLKNILQLRHEWKF